MEVPVPLRADGTFLARVKVPNAIDEDEYWQRAYRRAAQPAQAVS